MSIRPMGGSASSLAGAYAPLVSPAFTGTPTINGSPIGSGVETVNTVAASGTAQTLPDVSTATMHDVTLTGNCTITLPAPGAGKSFLIRLTQDGTGGRTVTWATPSGAIKWGASGVAPTITATAAGQDELVFHSFGTNWTGALANKDIK